MAAKSRHHRPGGQFYLGARGQYYFGADIHQIQGRPPIVHWRSLREQFGQEYKGKDPDKDFKKKFLAALQAVMAVYPKAKVKRVTGGLLLMASPPPIRPAVHAVSKRVDSASYPR
ncbi:hypothetical protein L0Z26_21835 [Burkholderia multivorans]|uniref:hypothetical protein n=1 Tax=Burkholderia multivorans TaxID=87883 RepID=UPI002019556B|nr:hypothetical protein [Burkholderia multivorans]MCO1344528.1 hypothetical protein [Burkholderia multivorans]MCO1441847.1 hypothetical protein [Burkholderia multivorans]UQO28286.1 hypothetical protein L0Z21_15255 [Burkholderia multivorans]UQO41621.1 hypothetical protein L0Z43_15790 [Burkholderia multivorans]